MATPLNNQKARQRRKTLDSALGGVRKAPVRRPLPPGQAKKLPPPTAVRLVGPGHPQYGQPGYAGGPGIPIGGSIPPPRPPLDPGFGQITQPPPPGAPPRQPGLTPGFEYPTFTPAPGTPLPPPRTVAGSLPPDILRQLVDMLSQFAPAPAPLPMPQYPAPSPQVRDWQDTTPVFTPFEAEEEDPLAQALQFMTLV